MNSKKKILIVDDSEMNRALLEDMLSDDYEILEAENGYGSDDYNAQPRTGHLSCTSRYVMPVMDGFDTLAMMIKTAG